MNINRYRKVFIIGAPNSGSTSLWHLIRQHPEISMAEIKEPRFFTDENYSQKWEWYESLFNSISRKTKVIGEASVSYSETHIWPCVPKRIKTIFPSAKIIYIVRNPITRLESCWKQALSTGHWQQKYYSEKLMSLDFNKAVLEYPHFLGTCKYWEHLSAYRKYFTDEDILVLTFEDFVEDQLDILKRCYGFLEVDESYINNVEVTKKNAGNKKRMTRPSIGKIKSFLNDEITNFIPEKIKSFVRDTIGTKNVPQKVDWDSEVKQKVLEILKQDVIQILRYCGKQENYWKMTDL
jgi:hypothetical protein